MLHAERDIDDGRKDFGCELDLALQPMGRHESPDVLVARGWELELPRSRDEATSDLGSGRIIAGEALELFDQPLVESRGRCHHLPSLNPRAVAACHGSAPTDPL
jgi:hypothetical protein